jgi:hypothetical protein
VDPWECSLAICVVCKEPTLYGGFRAIRDLSRGAKEALNFSAEQLGPAAEGAVPQRVVASMVQKKFGK